MGKAEVLFLLTIALFLGSSAALQCGIQAGNALGCNGLCCCACGWCGSGCESQCGSGSSPPLRNRGAGDDNDVSSIITEALFHQMLPKINDPLCHGFYTYTAFIDAARSFPGFGTTGNLTIRKRELAAFFGQTSQETTGGSPNATDGPYAWGYCHVKRPNDDGVHCTSSDFPCASGRKYYGRGPIMLTNNHNYGLAGQQLSLDLTYNPDLVETNAWTSFETAIWFWMTPQYNKPSSYKPSSHDVMTGQWKPSADDENALRYPGYGVVTNIIAGAGCGTGFSPDGCNRIGYYMRYCNMLGVTYGDNIDCSNQTPFP